MPLRSLYQLRLSQLVCSVCGSIQVSSPATRHVVVWGSDLAPSPAVLLPSWCASYVCPAGIHCKTTALITTTVLVHDHYNNSARSYKAIATTPRNRSRSSGPVNLRDNHYRLLLPTPTVGPVPPAIREPGPGRFATIYSESDPRTDNHLTADHRWGGV